MQGVFITGTDTNVGKTWVSARLIPILLEKGIHVVPRKPVESGWNHEIEKTDAWTLAHAAGMTEYLDDICPNRFLKAISPVRAATIENTRLCIDQIFQQCTNKLTEQDFVYVEGAGGFYSPLASDGLNADLARLLKLPVLLIADNRLGCINQVLLNAEAIKKCGLHLSAIALNQSSNADPASITAAMNNIADISSYVEQPVISITHHEHSDVPFQTLANLLIR